MKTYDSTSNGKAFHPTREQVNEFIQATVIGVLSTLDSDGAPMGATVAFSTTANGCLLVGTQASSRKSQNISGDPRVAVTITDADKRYTLQLEGIARKLTSEEFERDYAAEHYRQRPESLPFKDRPGECHILVEPLHIRFADCNASPWVTTEFDG